MFSAFPPGIRIRWLHCGDREKATRDSWPTRRCPGRLETTPGLERSSRWRRSSPISLAETPWCCCRNVIEICNVGSVFCSSHHVKWTVLFFPVYRNLHFLHFSIFTQTIDGLWCKYQKNKEIFYCFYHYGVWLLNFFISKCPNHVPIILVYGGKNGASVETKMRLLMFLIQISRDFIRAETKCIHTYEVLAFYFLPDHLHF